MVDFRVAVVVRSWSGRSLAELSWRLSELLRWQSVGTGTTRAIDTRVASHRRVGRTAGAVHAHWRDTLSVWLKHALEVVVLLRHRVIWLTSLNLSSVRHRHGLIEMIYRLRLHGHRRHELAVSILVFEVFQVCLLLLLVELFFVLYVLQLDFIFFLLVHVFNRVM